MAECNISDARKEAAFQSFEVEFTKNGFEVPTGLIRLLREYKLKPGESNLEARARLYKRLWCLLWFGSKNTLGSGVPGEKPTYVYPDALKAVIREIIPGNLTYRDDPTHERVYKVNIGDLSAASWPSVKQKRNPSKK